LHVLRNRIRRDVAADDVWEFLDNLETYFASERDGVIYRRMKASSTKTTSPIRAFQ
jgi:hypothetical protein